LKKILKKKYKKIGILGGTFDPPHIGHLHISRIGLERLQLNSVMWIVTKRNPFKKKPLLSVNERIKLSKEITKKEKRIQVKYFDSIIKSRNTFKVLNFIRKKNKKNKLFFLIGADNLLHFHKWYNWRKIPKIAKIIVFARSGYASKALNSIASKKLNKKDWSYINSEKINISSSLIRKF